MNDATHLPILARAYTELADDHERDEVDRTSTLRPKGKRLDRPSRWSLAFDCETTVDAAQALRVGSYQIRQRDELFEEGLFVDPDVVTAEELGIIERYAIRNRLKLHTVRVFCDEVFLKYGYKRRALIIGFNLPFDLSRIALSWSPARRKPMRGGISITMSENSREPRVRVRKVGRRQALIDFAIPEKQETPRGQRKRGLKVSPHRGYFLDIGTFAAATLSQGFTLARLSETLETATRKEERDDHGAPIADDYLDYVRLDVQCTWECYVELRLRYQKHSLRRGAHKVLSEASIGKAYLDEMGVQPLLRCKPDMSRDVFAKAMCSYYGGRAEVRIRREIREVLHTDFKSMYPTVNTLMGLWSFVIAQDLRWRDSTDETRAWLSTVDASDFQVQATWRHLTTLVRLKAECDLVPVRAQYDQHKSNKTNTIGLNFLTCGQPLGYTLADVVAAKILAGKTPEIAKAVTFAPGEPQEGLNAINLFGREDFHVDPYGPSVFKCLVDLRDSAKASGDAAEKTIKILVNATSYGVFIEVIRDTAGKPAKVRVLGASRAFDKRTTAIEEPGGYFHPLLGTLITGAARLMLALAEHRIDAERLEWVFCDTDSMAIARPTGMARSEFHKRARRVVDWFVPLNPYEKPGSILQFEKVNNDQNGTPTPLYAFAISAKRYALFNRAEGGSPIIRKASQHGLGHLIALYKDEEAPGWITAPRYKLGIARWQHDVWYLILKAALSGDPDHVDLSGLPNINRPAISQLGTSNWQRVCWFDAYCKDLPLHQRVRPFNFLISFFQDDFLTLRPGEDPAEPTRRGRPRKSRVHPVAPFNRDPARAHLEAFDRQTGDAVLAGRLKTYLRVLSRYHVSNESKFGNGEGYQRGLTTRRHVIAPTVGLIGKEANSVDEDDLGWDVNEYGHVFLLDANRRR